MQGSVQLDRAEARQAPLRPSLEAAAATHRSTDPATGVLVEGRNCWRRARADRVAFLVDAADYFDAFARAALKAESCLWIVGWDFDSRIRLWCDNRERADCKSETLGDFLNELARRKPGLRIRILIWDFPWLYAAEREPRPIFGPDWRRHRHIDLRYDNTHTVGSSHHQKMVVIDDKVAFVGGMDLSHERWDTPEHIACDPRRTHLGKECNPVHDMSMAVEGDIARVIGECARERWRQATGRKVPLVSAASDPWPAGLQPDLTDVDVAVARTLPAYDGGPEVREIEALYQDMIAAARHGIYIENQYFTSAVVGEALAQRLQEPDGPEVVLVLRRDYDGWLEGSTVGALRARLLRRLYAADYHDRLRVYYPVVPNLGERHLNVHSKLMIVDDELVRVGSANISNRSMGADSECDLAIEARGDARIRAVIQGFRQRLLGEHLGVEPQLVASVFEREGSLIRAVESLRGGERTLRYIDDLNDWSDGTAAVMNFTDPERPVSLQRLTEELAPASPQARHAGWVLWKLLPALLLCAGLFALWRWTPLREIADPATVRAWAETLRDHPLAPAALVGSYLLASVLFFPRTLVTLAAVVIFGPWVGFVYALLGILAAALLTYGIGRLMRRDTVRRWLGPRLNRISRQVSRRGLPAIIALRLAPVAPFIVVNVVAGAIRIRLNDFALGTAIAILPGLLVATVFGHQIDHVLYGVAEFNLWLVAAVVLATAAGLWLVRRRWLQILQ